MAKEGIEKVIAAHDAAMSTQQPDKEIDDGGPAYPCFHEDTGEIAEGMSLRMWLAGRAMQGLCANVRLWEVRCMDYQIPAPEIVAQDAFAYADALILESQK